MAPPHDGSNSNNNNVMNAMTSDYNELNQSQSTVWKHAQPLFAHVMKKFNTNNGDSSATKSFRVADLGCATGGNSIAPLSYVSSQVQPTGVMLEGYLGDLPQNAWNELVQTVTPTSITGRQNQHDHSSQQQQQQQDTFIYMVGQTFYQCCTPPLSLDLSYSLVAVHWMKSYAGDIPTGLYATDPLHVTDLALLQAWKDAGAIDFLDFTNARLKELKVNGYFIGAIACPKQNGHYPWSQVGMVLHNVLQTKVSKEALGACVLPCCWRTEGEVRAGFQHESWELEICSFYETKDPIREQLEHGTISSHEYGRVVIQSFRAVCHPTCVTALSKFMSDNEVHQVLETAYEECIGTIASDPEQYNLDVSFWYVLARKTKEV